MKATKFITEIHSKYDRSRYISAIVFLGLMLFLFKPVASLTFLIGVFVFVQSLVLYFFLRPQPPKKSPKKLTFIILPLAMGIFILITGVYKDTFYISNFEKNQMWERRELYRRDLGIVGRSNLGNAAIEKTKFYLDKLSRKTMEPFDLSRYFSADPSSVYHLIFFPLFIIGVFGLLVHKMRPLFYYLGWATMGTILVQPNLAIWLFVPVINLSVWFGLNKLWEKYKN
jgi:hypothetical protein